MCFFLELFLRNKEGFQPSKQKVDFVTGFFFIIIFIFTTVYILGEN